MSNIHMVKVNNNGNRAKLKVEGYWDDKNAINKVLAFLKENIPSKILNNESFDYLFKTDTILCGAMAKIAYEVKNSKFVITQTYVDGDKVIFKKTLKEELA